MWLSMLFNTVLMTGLLAAAFSTVDAARKRDTDNEMVGTLTQAAIRQAAPVVPPIPVTVDGKIIFSNTTGVDVGGPPWRNSPSRYS
jgi:hypothetical protein